MGQPIMRLGDKSTGHAPGYPPTPSLVASTNVKVNGLGAVRMGDKYQIHCFGSSCHVGAAVSSSSVYVNKKPVHRTGDPIDCGDTAGIGSTNVKAG